MVYLIAFLLLRNGFVQRLIGFLVIAFILYCVFRH
jgi:hypothetical protein